MKTAFIHIITALALLLGSAVPIWAASVTVFAAASTTNAVIDIADLYETQYQNKPRLSFASSSTLAKQIENGAPADIFISANPKWMDYLVQRNAVIAQSRIDLLGNRLVLIAPAGSAVDHLTVHSGLDLAGILAGGRLSMGDPDHVPAGMYGKKAMENLKLWSGISSSIARAKDVRAALVLVERGETPLGQVYETDAAVSAKVRVVGVFPEDSHPKIVYPAALVTQKKGALAFFKFLQTEQAKAVFKKYGFSIH